MAGPPGNRFAIGAHGDDSLEEVGSAKSVIANQLWKRTAVSTGWNVEWLAMGHARTDSWLAKAVASREPIFRKLGRIVGAG